MVLKMSDMKYMVVILIAALALGAAALGQSGMLQSHASGASGQVLSAMKAVSRPGVSTYVAVAPMGSPYGNRASKAQCVQSCRALHPEDGYSVAYKACTAGCR